MMRTTAKQDAVPPVTPLESWSPAISEPQAPQVKEMDTARDSEALELTSNVQVANLNHR